MGYNQFTPNNDVNYNRWSTNAGAGGPTGGTNVAEGVQGTAYTVGQLSGLGLTTFNIAIDSNTAMGGETLNLFEVWINNALAYVYDPGIKGIYTDGTSINPSNQGNGYGDFTLNTVDLTGLNSNFSVLFHAIWTGASDGAESFFLDSTSTPPPPPVPEPATLALVGLALVGLGAASRRGRKA
jgi:hypothetical protein